MNVAWDARKLWDGGIGTYIRETLGAISTASPAHTLSALVSPADRGSVAWPGPVAEREVEAGKYGLAEHVAVARAARAAGAQLLHAPHYTLPMGWNGPSIVTIHDLIHVQHWRFFRPGVGLYALAMAGSAAHRARHVITDSEHVREVVIDRLRVPEHKVTAIPLAAPSGLTRATDSDVAGWLARHSLERGYLLYVGARKRHKNLALLIEAHARLPRDARPALVLSGAPFERGDPLGSLAHRCGTAAEIGFAGELRDLRALACAYSAATLYVHPSLAEGFGLPPLEAMACGTPVLSSTAGSLKEVVGDAGLLLPPENPEVWATVIAQLLADPARRARMADAGRAHAARFSWRTTAQRTMELYERECA